MSAASLFETRRYSAGEIIVLAGDPAAECFVVHSGRVEVLAPGNDGLLTPVGTRGPGHVFGELGLTKGRKHYETVRALEDSVCVAVSHAAVERKTADADPFVGALVTVLTGHLVSMIDRRHTERSRLESEADEQATAAALRTEGTGDETGDDLEALEILTE